MDLPNRKISSPDTALESTLDGGNRARRERRQIESNNRRKMKCKCFYVIVLRRLFNTE